MRPTTRNDEFEQILNEQDEFIRSKKRPAAKVIRRNAPVPPKSESEQDSAQVSAPILDRVVERDVISLQHTDINKKVFEVSGFPHARKESRASIFGRRRQSDSKCSASGKTNAIHIENEKKIASMSVEEIQQAQKELRESLDPAVIQHFMNHKDKERKGERPIKSADSGVHSTRINWAEIRSENDLLLQSRSLPLEERAKHAWIHPVEESERSGNTIRSEGGALRYDFDGGILSTNSNGMDETDSTRPAVISGLYHHGDDPQQPGYTLSELEHLARSTVASQRAMALRVIAKILRKRELHFGKKSSTTLGPTSISDSLPLTLRCALDDTNQTVMVAAVDALHALLVPLYFQRLEILGDNSELTHDSHFSFEVAAGTLVIEGSRASEIVSARDQERGYTDVIYHSELAFKNNEDRRINGQGDSQHDISDSELIKMDLIQGLFQTRLPLRLIYILRPLASMDVHSINKVLEILSVMAQHSPRASSTIVNQRKVSLIAWLQTYFFDQELENLLTEKDAAVLLSLQSMLRLVRILCQSGRPTALQLMQSGLLHTIRGILAIRNDSEAFAYAQIECYRIWRVLLGFRLDFHCFSYHYSVLCEDVTSYLSGSAKSPTITADKLQTTKVAAIFASLVSFCELDAVPEAQHYFGQLVWFVTSAHKIIHRDISKSDRYSLLLVSASLRFLAAACKVARRFSFDVDSFTEIIKLVQANQFKERLQRLVSAISSCDLYILGDLLVALVTFQRSYLAAGLEGPNQDEYELVQALASDIHLTLLHFVSRVLEARKTQLEDNCDRRVEGVLRILNLQAAQLLLAIAKPLIQTDTCCLTILNRVYVATACLLEKLVPGMEAVAQRLLVSIILKSGYLASITPLHEDQYAVHVLQAAYQALVGSSRAQEEHTEALVRLEGCNTLNFESYHLRIPQEATSYIASNLPFPSSWLYAPFSRMQYLTSRDLDAKQAPQVSSEGSESIDDTRKILTACCRYLKGLETMHLQLSELKMPSISTEEKIFHLFHPFFTSSLFDESLTMSMNALLSTILERHLGDHDPENLKVYEQMVAMLDHFSDLDPAGSTSTENGKLAQFSATLAALPKSEQAVMVFVEHFINEFATASFGNSAFAHFVTLIFTSSFPSDLRKSSWKELMDACMLHTLGVPSGIEDLENAMFQACASGCRHTNFFVDQQWAEWITISLSQLHLSSSRGRFAYALAVHYLAIYIFGKTSVFEGFAAPLLPFGRQQVVGFMLQQTPLRVWLHVISYVYDGTITTATPTISLIPNHDQEEPVKNTGIVCEMAKKAFPGNTWVNQRLDILSSLQNSTKDNTI